MPPRSLTPPGGGGGGGVSHSHDAAAGSIERGNRLGDRAVRAVIEALVSHRSLLRLDLSGNGLRASGAALASLLLRTRALQRLALSWNCLGVGGYAARLALIAFVICLQP